MCLKCKKFFFNRTFYKHKGAYRNQAQPVKTQTLRPLDLPNDDEFVLNILNKFAMVLLKVISDKVKYFKLLDINISCMEGRIQKIYWSKKGSYDADERTYKIVLLSEDDVKFEDLFERNYLQTLKAVYLGRRGEIWT